MSTSPASPRRKIDRSGISYVNRIVGTTIAPVFCFFIAAGRLDILAGWIYFGVFLLFGISNVVLLAVVDADLLNARGRTEADVVGSDRIVVGLYLLFTHVFAPIVAGLEHRLRPTGGGADSGPGSMAPLSGAIVFLAVGVGLLALGAILENRATRANHHYERNIRLQTDRDHAVVTTGPYAIVRHPGYLAYILKFAALPVALSSVWAVGPVVAGIIALVVRTVIEDRVLLDGLPGYREYAARVRFRLVPGVW